MEQVNYMDVPYQILKAKSEMLPVVQQKSFHLMYNCAKALWAMSKSDKNKNVMRQSGIIPVMAKLLSSVHEGVVSSIMGIIVNCATQVHGIIVLLNNRFLKRKLY